MKIRAIQLMYAASAAVGLCAAQQSTLAQSVSYSGGTYSQNFDTLSSTGSTTPFNAWSNGTTLNGWYSFFGSSSSNAVRDATTSATSAYRGDVGGSNAGALYSFGVAGTNPVDERALGVAASGSFESVIVLVIQNTGSVDLDSFTLGFDGEQWRNGNNATAQKLEFDYSVLAAIPAAADVSAANQSGYTGVSALDFTGPITGTTASALDGNLAANRVAGISSTVTATIPVGSYLVLRWWDNNDPGNDHGLAIDNVSFSATPAPGAAALLGLGGLLAARRRRN